MNNDLHITATVDEPYLLENLVERLAGRHYEIGCSEEKMPVGLKAIESSTVEVYISGYVEFDNNGGGALKIPFITSFVFTCIRASGTSYQLNWSISLS